MVYDSEAFMARQRQLTTQLSGEQRLQGGSLGGDIVMAAMAR